MRKLPWNADAPKWECRARVRRVTAEGFTIWIPAGTDFRMADGSTWTGQDDSLDHYWYGAWRQVMELSTPGPHWYVNVIEPVAVSDDVVTWRDMIADVEASTDGTFHIADIPELVHARRSLPADVLERVRQAVDAIVDDIRNARPPFRRTVPETPYGSEESRFWLVPGAGDGLAVIGDLDGVRRLSVERMLERLNPASVHGASVNPLMVLPPEAPPRDGVLIAGAPRELDRLVQHARAALGIYGGRTLVTLALALEHETDPLASFTRRWMRRNRRRPCAWTTRCDARALPREAWSPPRALSRRLGSSGSESWGKRRPLARLDSRSWIPASAGMTASETGRSERALC